MDRPRPLLAMIICLGIFLLFMRWQAGEAEKQDAQRKAQEAQRDAREAPQAAQQVKRPAQPAENAGANGQPSPVAPAAPDAPEADRPARPERAITATVFRTERIEAHVTSDAGGGVEFVRLPAFKSSEPPAEPGGKRDELTLLPKLRGERPLLSLRVSRLGDADEDRLPDIGGEAWEASYDEEQRVATFTNTLGLDGAATGGGLVIVKRMRVLPDEQHVAVDVTFRNTSAAPLAFNYELVGPGGVRTEITRAAGSDIVVISGRRATNGPPIINDVMASGLESEDFQTLTRDPAFVGIQNNYFMAALAPVAEHAAPEQLMPSDFRADLGSAVATVSAQPFRDPYSIRKILQDEYQGRPLRRLTREERQDVLDDAIRTARTSLLVEELSLAPNATLTHKYIVYLGPRDNDVLDLYENLNLAEANDYGWWTAIVRLFMGILSTFHAVTGSWGVSIILLTLVVRSALHPLNRKQQAGMMRYQKKIAKVQPRINEIKEQFKDDRMAMNTELQKVFKENGINPFGMMGGCLMVFLQLPIWIGLIQTLNFSLDLRQAPFMGWISDLAQPDRLMHFDHDIWLLPNDLNLLPLLYVVLMLVQQSLQPKATDPQARQQQRTMSIMMIAFGFIFYGFASGLLIYFLTSAIFGICETRIIKAKLNREDESSSEPALATAGAGAGGATASTSSGGGDERKSSSGPLYSSKKGVAKPKKPKKPKKWPQQ